MTSDFNKMEFAGNAMAAPAAMIECHDGPAKMNMGSVEFDATKTTPWERAFNPYDFNGGCVAFPCLNCPGTPCTNLITRKN